MEPEVEVVAPTEHPDLRPEDVSAMVRMGEERAGSLSLGEVQTYAQIFIESGLFTKIGGTKGLAQAVVKIQAGQELGIPPFAAMRGLNVMDGKVELSAGLMASKVKESRRYRYRILESDAQHCVLRWFERDDKGEWEDLGTSEWTIEEAREAGYIKAGSGWQRTPTDMLFARALSRGFRQNCPDLAIGGTVYVEGEVVETAPVVECIDADLAKLLREAIASLTEEQRSQALPMWREAGLPVVIAEIPRDQAQVAVGILSIYIPALADLAAASPEEGPRDVPSVAPAAEPPTNEEPSSGPPDELVQTDDTGWAAGTFAEPAEQPSLEPEA